ncbi:MAG: hypothetical protein O2840_04520 [bacterium]|nr:hypothetical protein [bacterium]
MRKVKILFTIVLLTLIAVTAYVIIPARDTFSLKEAGSQLATSLQNSLPEKMELPGEVDVTLENASTQAKALQEHATNILGATDKVTSGNPDVPIQERAFEYGRYLYCNQVVTDYEARNPQE